VRILITGGAGFIGSYVADELLAHGHQVRVLDSLLPQVHGPDQQRPSYMASDVELLQGDVRDSAAVGDALDGVDAVYHFAARVGVGQSMYEMAEYTDVNNRGTAVLLEALVERPVKRLIVASSMSIYGEGLYQGHDGEPVDAGNRTRGSLARGWELYDGNGSPLKPVPTPESKVPHLASIYALSKYDQERMCMVFGDAYSVPTIALRFFNVYGPRQALSNPYTGVLAIFASRLLNDQPPLIFEDGKQRRDFVSVHDVATACVLALTNNTAVGRALNIGSGRSISVREVAESLAKVVGKPHITPELTRKCRTGDIRHCFADISAARKLLGYEPRVSFEAGLTELAAWLRGQVAADRTAAAASELESRGLTVRGAFSPSPMVAALDRSPATDHGSTSQSDNGVHANGTHKKTPAAIARAHPGRFTSLNGHHPKATLITGGAGFIGSNLAARLLDAGRRVIVYDNLSRIGVHRNVEELTARFPHLLEVRVSDVTDRKELRAAVADAGDVFHLAAQVAVTTSLDEPEVDFDVNVRGTISLLEAVRRLGRECPVLYTSTNKVYGNLTDVALAQDGDRYSPTDPTLRARGISESRPLEFCSPYGCSKGAADQYVLDYARSYGLPTCVFRMSCIYGPRQCGNEDQGWLCHFIRAALEETPLTIYGDGRQVRDALYVDDLVDAMLLARRCISLTRGQAFNIGGGPAHTVSLLELLTLTAGHTGRTPRTAFNQWRTGDQRWYVSDTRKFADATGWCPQVGIREGVARLHQWLREHVDLTTPEAMQAAASPSTRRTAV